MQQHNNDRIRNEVGKKMFFIKTFMEIFSFERKSKPICQKEFVYANTNKEIKRKSLHFTSEKGVGC